MESATKEAIDYLVENNPLKGQVSKYGLFSALNEMAKTHGEKAIIDLAGFHKYMIANYEGEQQQQGIVATFAHDLNGRNDRTVLPRSHGYREFWTGALAEA